MTAVRFQLSSAEPMVSVVIPTYKREEMLRRCLQSLLRQDYPRFEVLVIDQDPERPLEALCAAEFADERTVCVNLPNAGLSAAKTHAVDLARGEICLFIDDDAHARDGWIAAYAETFWLHPLAGLAGGRDLGEWEAPAPEWFPLEYSYLIGHYDLDQKSGPLPPGHLPIGCNMGGRTKLIRAAGGFDPRFGYSRFRKRPLLAGEDSLLGLRIQQAGWELHYCAGATVDHSISARKISPRQFLKRNFWEGVTSIELRAAQGFPGRRLDYLRSQLPEIAMAGMRYLLPRYENRYALTSPQIRMMSLRRVAHASGVLFGALFPKIDPSVRLEPPPSPQA